MGNNWELHHLALMVRDLDKAVEYYQSLGIIDKIEPEYTFDTSELTDFRVLGKPAIHKGRARMTHIGSLPLEFLQVIEGEYPHLEFLNRHGEGIQHIGFIVDDLEKETAELVEKGVKLILSEKLPNGIAAAYFDTGKVGDIMIELMQLPKE